MGSVGASRNQTTSRSWVGESVSSLYDTIKLGGGTFAELYDRMRKTFDLPKATDKQLDSLRAVISGMDTYDRGYDENKTPFNITYFNIYQDVRSDEDIALRKYLGMRNTAQPIRLSISTQPAIDNALIRVMDAKDRFFSIGANGGFYTYTSKGKKVTVTRFDAEYGKRTWKG